MLRQRNKFINNLASKTGGPTAPRTTSGDRDPSKVPQRVTDSRRGGPVGREREKRPAPQPPTQRVRRSSVEVLETSMSESESPRQDKVNN